MRTVGRTIGPTIFFCGRHEERKGLDVLLERVRRARRRRAPVDRRRRPRHRRAPRRVRRATTGIEWLGRITDAEKFARLRGAHVFCAPSLHGESFGVVLIEAMAAGTPVVASALDGYRNVATDGVDAAAGPPGDVDALADRAAAGARRRVLGDALVAPATAGPTTSR